MPQGRPPASRGQAAAEYTGTSHNSTGSSIGLFPASLKPIDSAPMPRTTRARRADPLDLYIRAVQCPDAEVAFVRRAYRNALGLEPRSLREDFCGTGANACAWARSTSPGTRAIGLDLCRETLDWGLAHNVAALSAPARRRVSLLHADVRHPPPQARRVDAVLASNFSYWVFKTRTDLRAYFRSVRRSLHPRGGVFVLDAYGGYESMKEMKERRPLRGFTYVWEQERYDPASGDMTCHISFSFPDGSRLRRAFTYHWRLWTIPEIREILAEAGFDSARTTIYIEGDDGHGEGNGIFSPVPRDGAPADATFVAYIVAAD